MEAGILVGTLNRQETERKQSETFILQRENSWMRKYFKVELSLKTRFFVLLEFIDGRNVGIYSHKQRNHSVWSGFCEVGLVLLHASWKMKENTRKSPYAKESNICERKF